MMTILLSVLPLASPIKAELSLFRDGILEEIATLCVLMWTIRGPKAEFFRTLTYVHTLD